MCGIEIGETIEFFCKDNDKTGTECLVVEDKKVEYNGEVMSLTMAARMLCGLDSKATIQGPKYFRYKGECLDDIREDSLNK